MKRGVVLLLVALLILSATTVLARTVTGPPGPGADAGDVACWNSAVANTDPGQASILLGCCEGNPGACWASCTGDNTSLGTIFIDPSKISFDGLTPDQAMYCEMVTSDPAYGQYLVEEPAEIVCGDGQVNFPEQCDLPNLGACVYDQACYPAGHPQQCTCYCPNEAAEEQKCDNKEAAERAAGSNVKYEWEADKCRCKRSCDQAAKAACTGTWKDSTCECITCGDGKYSPPTEACDASEPHANPRAVPGTNPVVNYPANGNIQSCGPLEECVDCKCDHCTPAVRTMLTDICQNHFNKLDADLTSFALNPGNFYRDPITGAVAGPINEYVKAGGNVVVDTTNLCTSCSAQLRRNPAPPVPPWFPPPPPQPNPPGPKPIPPTALGGNLTPNTTGNFTPTNVTFNLKDSDLDGIIDAIDNCVFKPNAAQDDIDADGVGDVCDNCASVSNNAQLDSDSDTVGDACDVCPGTDDTLDQNSNGIPDCIEGACEDKDGDGLYVSTGTTAQSCQVNGLTDCNDNDPLQLNPALTETCNGGDTNCNGIVDDGLGQVTCGMGSCVASRDYCVNGAVQTCVPPVTSGIDDDGDGVDNECEACPNDAQNDIDGDLICGSIDNCPTIANQLQSDVDNDGIGDACDTNTVLPPGNCGSASVQTGSASPSANCGSGGGGGSGGGSGGGYVRFEDITTGYRGTSVEVSCIPGIYTSNLLCIEENREDYELYITQVRRSESQECKGVVVDCDQTQPGDHFYCNRASDACLSFTGSLCIPKWNTTPWSPCTGLGVGAIQSRQVEDLNHCGTNVGQPAEQRACFVGVPLAVVPPFLLDNCLVGVTMILLLMLIYIVWNSVREGRKPWAWMGVTALIVLAFSAGMVYGFSVDECFTALVALFVFMLSYLVWLLHYGESHIVDRLR